MAAAPETKQAIAKLTPLADVLALIERDVKPLAPRTLAVAHALHRVLAADAVAPARPARPIALIDGFALASEATLDASGYVPAPLARVPPRVDAGELLPPGADCVAPIGTIKTSGARAESLVPIHPGDNVLPAGGDSDGRAPLRRAGENLRAIDLAALTSAGVGEVNIRAPRVRIVARDDPVIGGVRRLVATDCAGQGGDVAQTAMELAPALGDAEADFVVAVGGTGGGRKDRNVQTLAREGQLAVHGIGLMPGETAAFGFASGRPVLMLPGRLDGALAGWLVVGRVIMKRLTQRASEDASLTLKLSRKIASPPGLAQLVPVRRGGDMAQPLVAKYLGFSTLAGSDGYVLVPAESEGYSADTAVSVWPWP